MSRPPPDSSNKPAQQAPPSAAKPTAQHSPIDTVAAQLVYDDLRRIWLASLLVAVLLLVLAYA